MICRITKAKPVDRFKSNISLYKEMYPDYFDKDGYIYGTPMKDRDTGKCYICINVAGCNHNTLLNNSITTMIEVEPYSIEYLD